MGGTPRTSGGSLARWCSAFMALCVLAACGGSAPPSPTPVVSSRRAQPVSPSDRLYRDDRSEIDLQRLVITNVDDLRLWWSRATAAAGDPKPPMPSVDFQTHMVLLVAAGRSDAGDQIQVDSVGFEIQPNDAGGTSTVSFAVVTTLEDCNPFPGVTYPLEIVRMPRANPAIDWIENAPGC